MADEGSDTDVPPLEDMSDLLHQVGTIQESKTFANVQKPPQESVNEASNPLYLCTNISEHSETVVVNGASTTAAKPVQKKPQSSRKKKAETFGGFSKGFLLSSGGSQSAKSPSNSRTKINQKEKDVPDDIPFIKPKKVDTKQTELQMPEVQEAMKATEALTKNTEWVTEDLLTKVQSNENVMHRLQDPQFMQAMAEFQTNPQAAMAKYQSNVEIQSFLKDFCGIMGDHFSNFATNQGTQAKPPGSANIVTLPPQGSADIQEHRENQASPADEQQMQQILANPEIHKILMDVRVQQLIESLRSNPDKAQSLVRSADQDLQIKIHKLIDVGLLQIQR